MHLRRFWIEFDDPDRPINWRPKACGVTAFTMAEAWQRIRTEHSREAPLPPINRIIADVDVSTLDEKHVLPNMNPPSWRGIWHPR
jgi:hypothetical protein